MADTTSKGERGLSKIQQKQKTFKTYVEKMRPSLEAILPRHVSVDQFLKVALVAASRQPELYDCTFDSIGRGLMIAAELGLEVGGALGQAYLVPFKNNKRKPPVVEATFILGYQGMIDLARRGGAVTNVEARLVYERDKFVVRYGIDPTIEHEPVIVGDPGKIIAAYMVFYPAEGRPQFDLMRLEELEAIRKRSRAKDSGPWVTDKPEMYRKTVARRGLKYAPRSKELAAGLAADQEFDLEVEATALPDGFLPEPPPSGGVERLKQELDRRKELPPEEREGRKEEETQVQIQRDLDKAEEVQEAQQAPEPGPSVKAQTPEEKPEEEAQEAERLENEHPPEGGIPIGHPEEEPEPEESIEEITRKAEAKEKQSKKAKAFQIAKNEAVLLCAERGIKLEMLEDWLEAKYGQWTKTKLDKLQTVVCGPLVEGVAPETILPQYFPSQAPKEPAKSRAGQNQMGW